MEYRIASALSISGEPASSEFIITLDKAVLQKKGAEKIIGEIQSSFEASVKHIPSPAPPPGGFDMFVFTASDNDSRPAYAKKVLEILIPNINKAFEEVNRCVTLICRNACHDPIPLESIDGAVAVLNALQQAPSGGAHPNP